MNQLFATLDRPAEPRVSSKPLRLAIVTSLEELCGIAAYSRALIRQLEGHAEVEAFGLDQYLLRSPYARVQRMGDRHIREIAAALAGFDAVNIQLEHGTLGLTPGAILRRFRRLALAAPSLTVTFHTVLPPPSFVFEEVVWNLARLRPGAAWAAVGDSLRAVRLGGRLPALLRRLQDQKTVRVITHTRRDRRLFHDVFRIREVLDHPLSFLPAAEARRIRASASRARFPGLAHLPPDAKLLGTFGFLSPYKGFDTAIRALRLLPPDHHLLIFGGVHPQAIRRNQPIDPTVDRLLGMGGIGQTVLDALTDARGRTQFEVGDRAEALFAAVPGNLHGRVHFMGALPDADFAAAMAVCDAVLLPYLEVGQSSSGPISIALEMGCRVIASRTLAFLQFDRYHPGAVEFFDIGNFSELAARIAAPPAARPERELRFDARSNAALYVAANTPPAWASAPARVG
jgi:glycosyltransferase involved in cell wall biosynthesis